MSESEPVGLAVDVIGDTHRASRWVDRNGDEWRWHHDDRGHGWQYLNHADPDARWRYGGMHIPNCGPFTRVTAAIEGPPPVLDSIVSAIRAFEGKLLGGAQT